jgi:hypothetical protein
MVLLNDFFTISNKDDKCVTRMHLIKSVHHDRIGIVLEDEEEDNSGAFFSAITLDQSDWAVLHFTGTKSLRVNVVQLLYL